MKTKNQIILFAIIIFSFVAVLYYEYDVPLEKYFDYLKVPAIIISVFFFILLNLPSMRKKMASSNSLSPYKKILFLENDEHIIIDLGYKNVIRLTLGFIPMFHIFSKVLVTNKRIQFSHLPYIPSISSSIFFKPMETKSFLTMPHIVHFKKKRNNISIKTSDTDTYCIYIKDQQTLSKITELLTSNVPPPVSKVV